MTDKELIKQEIERLYAEVNQKPYNGELEGEMRAYDKLISFIDSLPKESGCEVNFTAKNEDLEEYAKKLTKGAALDKHNLIWMCKKGAEWQKQQMKEILQTEYEKGRFDMREEMMKDAMEGWCINDGHILNDIRTVETEKANLKIDDKVKIIIIKSEQQ